MRSIAHQQLVRLEGMTLRTQAHIAERRKRPCAPPWVCRCRTPSVARKMRPAREVGTPATRGAPRVAAQACGLYHAAVWTSDRPSHGGSGAFDKLLSSVHLHHRRATAARPGVGAEIAAIRVVLKTDSHHLALERHRGFRSEQKVSPHVPRAERGHLALPPDERRRKPFDLLTCRQLLRKGLPTRCELPRDFGLTRCLTVEVGKESTLKRERCRSSEHAAVGFERCH